MKNLKNLSFDSIGFFGSLLGIGTISGYGYAAVNLIRAWQHYYEMPCWWGSEESRVAFSFTQPTFYEYKRDRLNIGYTPWESTVIPNGWKYYIDKMTELWTTSNACKEWYEKNGIEKPIRVLHHGINRKHFPVCARELKGPFTFLHIGSETKRKGGAMVLSCFSELFGNDPRYHLILKGNPPWDTDLSNVSIIRDYIPQEKISELYQNCHAMVYPTNGEGFGLIPFNAAASGMPTAVTNWGGPRDFMDFCYPIGVADLIKTTYEPHEGLWALPDIESIKKFMIEVTSNSELCFNAAYEDAVHMDAEWSWQKIAGTALGYMQEYFNNS